MAQLQRHTLKNPSGDDLALDALLNNIQKKQNSVSSCFQKEIMKKSVENSRKEQEKEEARNLVIKVSAKIQEAKRLIEDMSVDFQNTISRDGDNVSFAESSEQAIDNVIASIRAAGLVML